MAADHDTTKAPPDAVASTPAATDGNASSTATEQQQQPLSPLQRFWRGTLLQCIITGLVSFCEPGIWNALNSLGAGGQQKPYLVNAANAITFGWVPHSSIPPASARLLLGQSLDRMLTR